MSLVLPRPTPRYDATDQNRLRLAIEQADARTLKRDADQSFNFNLFFTSIETGITASSTQSQGEQPLTEVINIVETVGTANDVVTLPPAKEGRFCYIRDNDPNALQIFPASGDAINGGTVDASVSEPGASGLIFVAVDDTNWYTMGAT